MKARIVVTIMGLALAHLACAQSTLDSLVQSRDPDFIDGKVQTYFTPGHRDIALKYQRLITEAVAYYEQQHGKIFTVKLAVIDSSQWLHEIYPFGFVFYTDGWIAMNTGMSYESFKVVYGLQSYAVPLEKELIANKVHTTQMMNSFFDFYALHELGHYFIERLSNAKSPDNWTDEFSASYLSYEFFADGRLADLRPFELFCQVDRDNYLPTYSTIADFNEKYAGTGLENYVWYHSNFYFLVKELYTCRGKGFISSYETEFNRNIAAEFKTDEIVQKLDRDCGGLVRRWVNTMESKANGNR